MYQNNAYYPNTGYQNAPYYKDKNNDRILGGFLGPFVLGGITGGLVSPYFYRPYPYYQPRPYPIAPYPRYW